MTDAWRVEVSDLAEAALRDLSRAAAARVADRLDDLARHGPGDLSDPAAGDEWIGALDVGDYELTLAGRHSERACVLVRIDAIERPASASLVDALPLAGLTRFGFARWVEGLAMDLRYTVRSLRRNPVFTLVVVVTLAVGLGGAAALLNVVGTVYRGALPFAEGDRLVRIRNQSTATGGEIRRYNMTPADFHLIRNENRVFTEVLAMAGRSLSLIGEGPAERVSAIGVTPNWVATLGLRPELGRAFTAGEEAVGEGVGVALISHALWQRRFGADSAAIGRELRYDGGALTVVGVLPRGLNYPYDADVWTPALLAVAAGQGSSLNVAARLAPGTTLDMARAEAARLQEVRASEGIVTTATGIDVATLRADFIRDDARILDALAAAVLFLLVLTCFNVANLLVGKFAVRRSELGIRAALGAGRGRQVRQLFVEATALFLLGGIGGLLVSAGLADLMVVLVPEEFTNELGMSGMRLGLGSSLLVLGGSMLAGLAVGGLAAARAARADLVTMVKQGAGASAGRSDRRLLDTLVVAQLGLSLVLLVGAGALIDHFYRLSATDPGYRLDRVATIRVTLEQDRYAESEPRLALVRALEAAIAADPNVESVGVTSVNPLCCGDWGAPVEIEDRPLAAGEAPTLVAHSYVTPGFFSTLSIGLTRGVAPSPMARPGGNLTVVVDEAFARMMWPGEDPVGKRVRIARSNEPWRTVTGIVPVVDHEADMQASWYLPYFEDPLGASAAQVHLMVRGKGAVDLDALRRVVQRIDPDLAAHGATTMQALQAERVSQDRLGAVVSALFALFGLVLAGFSLFGLLSYSVEMRSPELGTRIALGATRGRILRLILGQAGTRLVAGVAIGLALAAGLNQLLRGLVAGVEWVPVPALLGLTATLAAIALAASIVPALRATRLDPVRCLKG